MNMDSEVQNKNKSKLDEMSNNTNNSAIEEDFSEEFISEGENSFINAIKKNKNRLTIDSKNSIVNCVVTEIVGNQYAAVKTGLKFEGIVPLKEFENVPAVGDKIDLVVVGLASGKYLMSYNRAKRERSIMKLRTFYKNHDKIKATVSAVLTPSEKYRLSYEGVNAIILEGKDLKLNVGDQVDVIITYFYHNKKYSNALKITAIESSNGLAFLSSIPKVGDTVDCIVRSCNEAFITVDFPNNVSKNLTGIIHIRDLPDEYVSDGVLKLKHKDKLKAKILKSVGASLILGLRQLNQDSAKEALANMKLGAIVSAIVRNVRFAGLGVDVNGINGFISINDLSWNRKHQEKLSKYKVGDRINAKIIKIDSQKNELLLSAKEMIEDPLKTFMEKHKVGSIVEGIVCKVGDQEKNFVFVKLAEDVDGILYANEMSWDSEKCLEELHQLKEGDPIHVKIHNFSAEKRSIVLSVKRKQRVAVDYSELVVGSIYDAIVVHQHDGGFVVRLINFPKITFFLRVRDVSRFNAAEPFKVKLVVMDQKKQLIKFSLNLHYRESLVGFTHTDDTVKKNTFADFH